MNHERPLSTSESADRELDRVSEIRAKFEALGHQRHVLVQVRDKEGQWLRDATAHFVASKANQLLVDVPDDQGVLERFEATDKTAETFKSTETETDKIIKLDFKFTK